MTNDFYIRNVANVVHSWMSYLYEVSKTEHLTAESSLRYPISGLLERKDDIILEMEVPHPCFVRKRIDFKWVNKLQLENKAYLEMKYVRDQSINIQEIFDDIFRLALIDDSSSKKYLLVCGKTIDFDAHFRKIPINNLSTQKAVDEVDGSYVVKRNTRNSKYLFDIIFSFNDKSKRAWGHKEISTSNTHLKAYYTDFVSRYQNCCKEGYQIPKRLKIRATLLQPIDKGLQSSVAIWEIEGTTII